MRCVLFALLAGAVACGGSDKPDVADPGSEPAERDKVAAVHDPSIHDDEYDHEDENSEFQVEGLKGHLDPYDIERGIEPHQQDLSACFFDRAKRKRYLGGRVEMGYTVGRDGAVKSVQMNKSTLGAWPVEKCLLEIGRSMSFGKPRGRGDADFSVPLDFTSARSVHWLTEEVGEAEVGEYVEELGECEGDVANVYITLYVGARGKVKSVGFASNNGPLADEWADCAEQMVMAWQLTDPRGKITKLSFLYNAR